MRISTILTCCALSFMAPFAMGGEGLIEERAWETAQESGTALSLKRFVLHFPESRFVNAAEARIAVVLRQDETVSHHGRLRGMHYVQ